MKRVNDVALTIGGLFVLGVMVLIAANVVTRAAGSPLPGSVSLAGFMLAVFTFLSLAACEAVDGHARMEAVLYRFSARKQAWILVIGNAVALAVYGLLLWARWNDTVLSWKLMQTQVSDIEIPVYPVKTIVVLGCVLMCVQLVINSIKLIRQQRAETPPDLGI